MTMNMNWKSLKTQTRTMKKSSKTKSMNKNRNIKNLFKKNQKLNN